MKIISRRYDIKPGAYVYFTNGCICRITGEYDAHHSWYKAEEVNEDENGDEITSPCVLTPSDLIGCDIDE